RMLEVLRKCSLAARLLPEVREVPRRWPPLGPGALAARFAILAWPMSEAEALALTERLKPPGDVRDLALLAARNRERLRGAAGARLGLRKATDALRRPERCAGLLEVARTAEPDIDLARAKRALEVALSVDAGAIAAASPAAEIPRRIDEARLRAIAEALPAKNEKS